MSKPAKLARWLLRSWTSQRTSERSRPVGVEPDAEPQAGGKDPSWLDDIGDPRRPTIEG